MKLPDLFQRFRLSLLLVLLGCAAAASAQTTTFTYQGRLTDANNLSGNGTYTMQFALYNDSTASAPANLLGTVTVPGVQVSKNVFTVQLNASAYGVTAFDGGDRWIEVRVFDTNSSNYVTLTPRQPVTSAPYSLRAANATNAANADTLDGLDSTDLVPTGTTAFVRSQTTPQTADFNVTGSGTVGGTLSAGTVNAATQYNIGGNRVLRIGPNNIFAGLDAGTSNAGGTGNSLFGKSAGFNNTDGFENSFFGSFAGYGNSTGSQNSFLGSESGFTNSTGNSNSLFGVRTGYNNTTGSYNSFFGVTAGYGNSTGSQNSFFGAGAGYTNTTGSDNSFFGFNAGLNTTIGYQNSFFGESAGSTNTSGDNNVFIGYKTGYGNTNGFYNSFVGNLSGYGNTTGEENNLFGFQAGYTNSTGIQNSFFGSNAGYSTTSSYNSFFGQQAGYNNTTGEKNTFVGLGAGGGNTTGSNNTAIGYLANVGSINLSYATAVGSGANVTSSNTVVLGRAADTVRVPGNLVVVGTVSKGGGSFKIDYPLDPANKTLSHSFVESPDMKNIYDGNVTTDANGEATVALPEYFEALNRDFRYQLTVIGQFAQAIVSEEIKDNRFRIRTDRPNVKVSWMVTGIRKDKFAEDNRIPNVEDKSPNERGTCLYEPACGGGDRPQP